MELGSLFERRDVVLFFFLVRISRLHMDVDRFLYDISWIGVFLETQEWIDGRTDGWMGYALSAPLRRRLMMRCIITWIWNVDVF